MKKLVLLLLLISSASYFAQVQLQNQIGPRIAIGYANFDYVAHPENQSLSRLFDSLQRGGLSLEVGATYKRRISREFSLSSSFTFSKYDINYLSNSLPSLESCSQNFLQFNMPIGIEYNLITENWQPFFGFYLNGTKIVKSSLTYRLQDVWNNAIQTSYLPDHTFLYGISVSTGAQLPIAKSFSLEPSFCASYSLRSLSNGPLQRPFSLTFLFTLMYNFN